jgi:hypothetical protein
LLTSISSYMYHTFKIIFLALFFVVSPADSALGQGIPVPNLPADIPNSRFATDLISGVDRPSLTLNGFDCGAACGNGLGLRQILESPSAITELQGLAEEALLPITAPPGWYQANENAARLEAYAFVALASYIVESNSHLPGTLGLPAHAAAASNLRDALTNPSNWQINQSLDNDLMKWTTHYMSMARALDLYYALENAYCHYGAGSSHPAGYSLTRIAKIGRTFGVRSPPSARYACHNMTAGKEPIWKVPDVPKLPFAHRLGTT